MHLRRSTPLCPLAAQPHRFLLPCLALALAVALVLALPGPARADVAPPQAPPGANPQPGTPGTQVRMLAETVVLAVQPGAGGLYNLGQSKVQADFTLRNLGTDAERMAVRFPLTFWNGESDGFFKYPEIQGFQAVVDGSPAPARRVTTPNSYDPSGPAVPWAAFDVAFPPNQDVHIAVTYTADGYGENTYVVYRYILETGAGWNGTIGSADLIVRLPYAADRFNVLLGGSTGFNDVNAPPAQLAGRELRWHFDELEPTSADNLEVSLVTPAAWQKVLAERANLKKNLTDGESWGRLAKDYKDIILLRRGLRSDAAGPELYQLSREAYEKCLVLKPDDPLWHYGYSDLLWQHYYWDIFFSGSGDVSVLVQALQQLKAALQLKPGLPQAVDRLDEIAGAVPQAVVKDASGGYRLLALTATPYFTPAPTELPGASPTPAESAATRSASSPTPLPPTPVPSAAAPPATETALAPQPTSLPPATPTTAQAALGPTQPPAPTAAPARRLPFCGGLLLFPFLLGLAWLWRARWIS